MSFALHGIANTALFILSNLIIFKIMPNVEIKAGSTHQIDLGNSTGMNISAKSGTAEVYVDKPDGSSSAIKASSGIGNPFKVTHGTPKAILKSDLETEHVRVGAKNNDIKVVY